MNFKQLIALSTLLGVAILLLATCTHAHQRANGLGPEGSAELDELEFDVEGETEAEGNNLNLNLNMHEEAFDEELTIKSTNSDGSQAEETGGQAAKEADKLNKQTRLAFGAVGSQQNYYPEFAALIFIAIYLINFFIGKRTNDAIANKWFNTTKVIFEQQFASVGVYQDAASIGATEGGVWKDSQSCFKLWCSGRRGCTGMMATLDLRKRHDLFSLILAIFDMSTTKDTLTLEIPMNEEDMEPFVFAIVRRRQEKKIRKQNKDLEYYTNLVKCDRLPQLSVLSESFELEQALIDDKIVRTLTKNEPLVQLIHFTDQNQTTTTSQNKKVLRFTYLLPTTDEQYESLKTLLLMSLYYVDLVMSTRLSSAARSKSEAKRKLAAAQLYRAAHKERQDAFLQKKQEMKAKLAEQEAQLELSPEALRKKEEREYKAMVKRNKPKVKVIR